MDLTGERLAQLEAKMDMVLKAVENLTANYPTKSEMDFRLKAIEQRQDKLEHAPWKMITIIVSVLSALASIYTIFHK